MKRVLLTLLIACPLHAAAIGIFEDHRDVGTVLHPGSVDYDPAAQTYTVSGSGENMWFASDAFHFVWKRMSGDATLSATVALLGEGGDPHRKAVLMFRQDLDPDSAYADVAVHGNGLASLQVREQKGDATHEIESNQSAPREVSLVKKGDYFRILVDGNIAGGVMRASITGTYYVGIGVCSHQKDAVQKVAFSSVAITPPDANPPAPKLYSTIEVINVASTDRRVLYVAPGKITAPSFTPDDATVRFTTDGRQESVPVEGTPTPTAHAAPLPTRQSFPSLVLSPDQKQLAFVSLEDQMVLLHVMSLPDNRARVLAKLVGQKELLDAPSWSPDSKRLVFVSYQYIP